MKISSAIVSFWLILASSLSAFAGGPTYSNGILGKIFDWKSEHAARTLGMDKFPGCGDAKVLAKITERYNWADRHTWKRGIELDAVVRTSQRLLQAGDDRQINRRYCRGHAVLSNGRHRAVNYLISQRQGFASLTWNVEFCVIGSDRWKSYSGSCRVLRR